MSDPIDRQAAIDEINDELDAIDHVPKWVFVRLTRRIEQLPSVQPEIIRCKDCKHYDPYDQTERFYCYDGIEGCLPNDFCSYGERREDE